MRRSYLGLFKVILWGKKITSEDRLHLRKKKYIYIYITFKADFCLRRFFERLIFIHLQCWEVLPFCRFQRQRCIKIRVLRAQDFYTPLALQTAKGQHLPALEVYKKQSPILRVNSIEYQDVRNICATGRWRFIGGHNNIAPSSPGHEIFVPLVSSITPVNQRVPNGVFQTVFLRFLTRLATEAIPFQRGKEMPENTTVFRHFSAFSPCRSQPPSEHTTLKNTV